MEVPVMLGLIGKKLGMSSMFLEDGTRFPVTLIETGPCTVTQKKTKDNDGYNAIQIGFLPLKERYRSEKKGGKIVRKKVVPNRPMDGHFKKCGAVPFRILREFKTDEIAKFEVGKEIKATDVFKEKMKVDVMGLSKGRGFAGGVKRHHYRGGDCTHGSMFHRQPGSIGASSAPSRVFKNTPLPGHMGNEKVTIINLDVLKVDADKNLVVVKGAVPGPNGGIVYVREAVYGRKGR
jgi:large subunit ribosomal protein L3